MTAILTSIHGRHFGLDKDNYATSPTGIKVPALGLGASGSEVLLTATGAEINRAADASTRVITHTTSALAITEATHDGKFIALSKATGEVTVTLPVASGSGTKLEFGVVTSKTSSNYTIKTDSATGRMAGTLYTTKDSTDQMNGWEAASTAGRIVMNGSTKGGIKGDRIELIDVAANLWLVKGSLQSTGTEATPFASAIA